MIQSRQTLVVIPARSGSKGLPGKNIRPLLGKPLIAWTIESALGSTEVDTVLVSTDSDEIRDIALEHGASAPFLRPDFLATDSATSVDVAIHALTYFREVEKIEFEYLVLLEPTSPIRNVGDVDSVISKLASNRSSFDAVVTVGRPNHHPSLLRKIDGDLLLPVEEGETNVARRQELEDVFFPFGVAYAVKTDALIAEQTFYPKKTSWHIINRDQEFEIDDLEDFVCVEAIMKMRGDRS